MRRSLRLVWIALAIGCVLPPVVAGGDPSAWRMLKNPEDAGYSSQALRRIREHYASCDLAALFIVHHGRVVMALGEFQRRFPCHSIRKSLMNAVMGIAVGQGRIDLDNTLAELGVDDVGGLTDTEKQATVRQLLQGRSGVYHAAVYETPSMTRGKPRRGAHPPGTFWYYNNWDFNILSTIVNQATGDDFLRLFRTRVAEPLGMEDYRELDGNYYLDSAVSRHPAYGFKLSARDLARFGLLYLQRGTWNGEGILSEQWVAESTRSYSDTLSARGGYGYLWWTPELGPGLHAFAACGVGTQVLLVVPELQLVVVQRVNTFAGKKHPFDPVLYHMVIDAVKGASGEGGELVPLLSRPEEVATSVERRETYLGDYRGPDGLYRILAYGPGLLITYPKGMQARLLPRGSEGEFLVEDVFEAVRLEKPDPARAGRLILTSPARE